MSDSDDIESIREQKKAQMMGDGGASANAAESAGAPADPIHVEGADHLGEIVQEYDVVFADFYADWCGPCKMLEPIAEDIAAETDAAVAKVDVDAHQQLAAQYRVQGVPTVVIFGQGEVAEQLTGVRDKTQYLDLIERVGA
ncbi:thioredoxin family protein [Halococcoides cellulosivorans]|uniref:Thioredoxin n=1 Tax=Halococcoides cellulosivorans TaxID=1679096 RepID=A0A2R4X0B3_9EURY|nr:thioredoxin domain-containing protein [Halococcoides cellulosivorans]AWB27229.1 thioredoxin [Halococcoides cellulosivorans]